VSWQEERQKLNEHIDAELARLGVSADSTFIPYSQSRNKGEWRSLNWKVRLKVRGRIVCESDYCAGEAHCPAYDQSQSMTPRKSMIDPYWDRIDYEIEHGFQARKGAQGGSTIGMAKMVPKKEPDAAGRYGYEKVPILPDTKSVVSSLMSDACVLDYPNFEEWADDTGGDRDSRKEEKIYRTCLKLALELRSGLGAELLAELQKLFQDW